MFFCVRKKKINILIFVEAYRALGCADDEGIIGSIGDGRDEIADGEGLSVFYFMYIGFSCFTKKVKFFSFYIEIGICESNKRLCEFGRCEKHQNSFRCICNIGYIAVNNGKRCQGILYIFLSIVVTDQGSYLTRAA